MKNRASRQRLPKVMAKEAAAASSRLDTPARRLGVLAVFFASGAAGLAYEVSWTRQIGLLFGQTVQSASIVLACYFLGMAIGYVVAGRYAGRVRPLVGYAVCEVIAGLWALLLPQLLGVASTPWAAALLSHDLQLLQVGSRAVIACLMLLPATVALGATLPFMAAYFSGDQHDKGATRSIALAYALNIGGAIAGVVGATMFGIATLGVAGTSYAAAGLSFACAAIAVAISRGSMVQADSPDQTDETDTKEKQDAEPVASARTWQALAALSGFGILALQVLYMRLFSLVLHNSVYSFGVVVAVFLIGLSLGSVFVSRVGKTRDVARGLFLTAQGGGIAISASLLVFLLWTGLEYFEAGNNFYEYLAGILGFSFVVMVVPVALLGIVLPWTWTAANAAAPGKRAAKLVGNLTAVNTLAAAAGSLAASFILLPTVGLWGSFTVLAVLYVVAVIVLFPKLRTKDNLITSAAAVAFCVMTFVAAGRYDGVAAEEELVDRWESAYGWIDVVQFRDNKALQLRQNIHYGLGSTGSTTMERRQTHIPLLLHPDPKDVLFIGLATGVTAGTALDHQGVTSTEVVELIPDVVRGAVLFKDSNRGIVESPKAKISINDGRHFLHAGTKQYDVITADLFVPWESHTGYLYTTENYQAAKRRLKPGGLFCQWLPLWQLGEQELRYIADSFATVFPNTTLWFGKVHEHWTIVGLVGSETPLSLDVDTLAERLDAYAAIHPTDKTWFKSPEALVDLYVGDWTAAPGAPLNTDERPLVEFSTPITAWTNGARLRYGTLLDFYDQDLAHLPWERVKILASQGSEIPSVAAVRARQRQRLAKERN